MVQLIWAKYKQKNLPTIWLAEESLSLTYRIREVVTRTPRKWHKGEELNLGGSDEVNTIHHRVFSKCYYVATREYGTWKLVDSAFSISIAKAHAQRIEDGRNIAK